MRIKDLTGQTFGRLRVLTRGERYKHGGTTWVCVCECGKETTVRAGALTSGHTQSCGKAGCIKSGCVKHGMVGTPTYVSWDGMVTRCRSKRDCYWKYYGSRGITVCSRWLTFENFLADMGERPPGTSIDRINNDGNYEPSNCRWATQKEQSSNKRNPVFIKPRNTPEWEAKRLASYYANRARSDRPRCAAITESRPTSKGTAGYASHQCPAQPKHGHTLCAAHIKSEAHLASLRKHLSEMLAGGLFLRPYSINAMRGELQRRGLSTLWKKIHRECERLVQSGVLAKHATGYSVTNALTEAELAKD